ncbi:MAG TPA: hypothetical protein ENL09_06905 [Bacteroidetes bacterium]|nr:hypothetical protein [Bacteroidota bacterium]
MILTEMSNVKFTPEMKIKAEKRFEWLTTFLIIGFKFVHRILGIMTKESSLNISTMGIKVTQDGKFHLLYNPVFVYYLTDSELVYVLYHEILHLVLHHCTSRQLISSEEKHFHELANIAHDLAVNELIPESEDCKRPRNEAGNLMGQFVSEYKKNKKFEDIEERQTAEWYFEYLRKKLSEKDGKCGNFDDHSKWREHETADERVRAKVREIDQNDFWGNISQTEKELILAAQVKKINWRNKIRIFFGNLAWKYHQSTRKRPDRRYGYQFPGNKKLYIDRWLIAADTSGSIDTDLLGQWLGVVNQLADELPVDFMQFDCEKTEDPRPFDRRKLKLTFKGRGGTNFQPVMDIVEKKKYKGVMILTDGIAKAPTKPKTAKILWVLPSGHNPPVDWGDRVHLIRGV